VTFPTGLDREEASSLEKALTSLSLTKDNEPLLNENKQYFEACKKFRGKHK